MVKILLSGSPTVRSHTIPRRAGHPCLCLGICLFLGGFVSALAQVPIAPNSAVPLPGPATLRTNPGVIFPSSGSAPAGDSPTPRSLPRPVAPPRSNSIVVPSDASSPRAIIPGTTSVTPGASGGTNAAPEEMIPQNLMTFKKADVDQVLMFYALLVNRTILRAANLGNPQITLETQTPLTKTEARQALDAVLALNGIGLVNVGDKFVKAGPLQLARTFAQAFNTNTSDLFPELGQYTTHVVQLKFLKPSEVIPVLQPFASTPDPPLAIDSSQILVIRDLAENVKRMLEMLKEIDIAVPSEYVSEVIPIKYAKASEIASAINSLSSGGGGATVGGSTGGSTRSLSGSRTSASSRFGSTGTGAGTGYPGGMNSGFNQGVSPQATTPAPNTGNTFTDRLRNLVSRASQQGEIVVLNQTKMISDERTNSLLIYASKEDMRTIKDIIAKLDVVLAQVLIEAVIIEVTLNDDRTIGVSYQEKKAHGIGSFFSGIGGINNGNLLSATTNSGLPGGFSYLGSLGQDLDITVTAVAGDSRARILQRPRIQTSHNEPANLFVGESRPYPSGSFYGGGFGSSTAIQAVNIGVTLEVTPLINPDGLVVMDIHQTIESANGSVNIANVGDVPITSRKEAGAKVSVRDHDTIILGGLIETSKSKSATGVPFLKDIPLLGYAFRSTTDKEVRNELIVLIRPTVLPTPEVASLTARAEKEKMPGVQRTEREIQAEETRRLKAAERDLKFEKNDDK